MATFEVVISEQKQFAISVLKIMFFLSRDNTPQEVENDFRQLGRNGSEHVNNTILTILIHFANNLPKKQTGKALLSKEHFNNMVTELTTLYSHNRFLAFMSWYGLKCATAFSRKNYDTLCSNIEHITLSSIIQENAWSKFQDAAQEMCKAIDCEKQLYPKILPYFLLDMSVDKKIILEIMVYVFRLYSSNLPHKCVDKLFLYSKDLSKRMKTAIDTLNEYSTKVVEIWGWEEHQLNLTNELNKNFSYDCFLEFCYCTAQVSANAFYQHETWIAPLYAFTVLATHYRFFKRQGFFTNENGLSDLENCAQAVTEEMKQRLYNRSVYFQTLSEFYSSHLPIDTQNIDTTINYSKIRRRNNVCCGCTCT